MSEAEIFDVSSSEFVSFSCMMPLSEFNDVVNGVKWEYRQAGNRDSQEAVIFIPGIYENTNGVFRVAPKLVELGYRVLVISIPRYDRINELLVGFDTLTASLQIFRGHLVGNDFGGFISLFLNNAKFLSCEIASLTLVSSYTNSQKFKKTITFFTPVGKGDLISEITPNLVPEHLKPSVNFVVKMIDSFTSNLTLSRFKCRQSLLSAPIPSNGDNILVIQPVDWAFKLDNAARPNKVIPGVNTAKLEKGGIFPLLAAPEEFLKNFLPHLKKFHSPM